MNSKWLKPFKNVFVLTLIAFAIWMFFFDNNSWLIHHELNNEIESLETEKVASVQIELIQILAKIQEKRALEPMQKLLQKEETPNYVKQELAYNIPSLL